MIRTTRLAVQRANGVGIVERLGKKRARRGAALIIALALVLLLVALTAGTQMQVVVQLKGEKGQRDYDRALEMAEAGANAFLNYLATGNTTKETPWTSTTPPPTITTTPIPSIAQVRSDILAGNVKRYDGTSTSTTSNTVNGNAYSNTTGLVIYPAQPAIATKPSLNNQTGYFVILTNTPAVSVAFVSYGYSNGIVRRVQVGGASSDIFDWAAIWGIQPSNGWNVTGGLTVVGGFGGTGVMSYGNNAKFYDGPGIASGPNASWSGTPSPPTATGTSSPGTPTGHIGTGTLASPFIRTVARTITFPTADGEANNQSLASTGLEYFRSNNNNFTGIHYLVWDGTHTNDIHELTVGYKQGDTTSQGSSGNTYVVNVAGKTAGTPLGYTVTGTATVQDPKFPGNPAKTITVLNMPVGTTGLTDTYKIATTELSPPADYSLLVTNQGLSSSTYNKLYGLRIYPGNYFFEHINMSSADIINVRSYNDADRSDVSMTGDTTYLGNRPTNDPVNPNSGDSTLRDVRVYVGHSALNANGTSDVVSAFTNGMNMEYYRYPSRFRVFIGSLTSSSGSSQVTVGGSSNSGLPAAFNVNMLVYNQAAAVNSGNAYGYIKFTSSAYLRGSLIAWNVSGSGGATVEKAAAEGTSSGPGSNGAGVDRLVYSVTSWKELP